MKTLSTLLVAAMLVSAACDASSDAEDLDTLDDDVASTPARAPAPENIATPVQTTGYPASSRTALSSTHTPTKIVNAMAAPTAAIGVAAAPTSSTIQTVNAQQSGPWSMSIAGALPPITLAGGNVGVSGSVNVDNTASNPVMVRDVDSPARQPVRLYASLSSATPQESRPVFLFGVPPTTPYSVPAGKRLVIEFAATVCEFKPGDGMRAELISRIDSNNTRIPLELSKRGVFDGMESWGGTQLVRLYYEPSTTLTIAVARENLVGVFFCYLDLTGHYVHLAQ